MPIIKQNKRLTLIALILVIGAIFFSSTAYASGGEPTQNAIVANNAIVTSEAALIVKEVWLTGDTLHINVSDKHTGEEQTLELNLRDYAKPADEYVTIQATDSAGRISNSVSFKNPYFEQTATPEPPTQNSAPDKPSESAIGGNPFTPDGTGTVVDNAKDGDGKEFFTVETPDGNVFYLIVDRQRDSENVYLLNAVNEEDLASLAKPGNGKNVSAIPTPEVKPTPEPPKPTEPDPIPDPVTKKGIDNSMLIFIGIVVVVIGGVGYYFKIVRPKKNGGSTNNYDEPEDDFDDDKELDLSDDDEDGEVE